MQGYVYGARMAEAAAYPGMIDCLTWARSHHIPISIVSHKTRFPFLGEPYDLHAAARNWIELYLKDANGPLVDHDRIFFELTKDAKVQRIGDIGCSTYVDDLPEILLHKGFPVDTNKLLFDPDDHHQDTILNRAQHWQEVRRLLEAQWRRIN
jgi:hypothetical protein